jgi:hypothetical protein
MLEAPRGRGNLIKSPRGICRVTLDGAGICDLRYFARRGGLFRATCYGTTVTPLLPDRSLLEGLARRDATALVELQRRHAGSLYALAYGILMDAERAERVVAEAFEQVWYAAEPLSRRRSGPVVWLRQQVKERARLLRGAQTTAA